MKASFHFCRVRLFVQTYSADFRIFGIFDFWQGVPKAKALRFFSFFRAKSENLLVFQKKFKKFFENFREQKMVIYCYFYQYLVKREYPKSKRKYPFNSEKADVLPTVRRVFLKLQQYIIIHLYAISLYYLNCFL